MEIVNYKEIPASQYELAVFDVWIGPNFGMTLRGFGLYKSKQGNYYIRSPSFKDKRIESEKPFGPAIDLSSERGKEFCKQVLDLLQPHIQNLLPSFMK